VGNINNINQKTNRFKAIDGLSRINSAKSQPLTAKTIHSKHQQPVLIDDFLPSSRVHKQIMPSLKLASQVSRKPVINKPLPVIATRTVKPAKKHQPQPSNTLMRHGLARPAVKERVKQVQPLLQPKAIKVVGPHEKLHRHEAILKQDVKRDFRVSHFGNKAAVTGNFSIKYQPLPVKAPLSGASIGISNDTANTYLSAKTKDHHQSVKTHYQKQVKLHRWRQRFFIAIVIVIIFLILGYLFYQLTPAIDVKVAAIHAGIPAQLPSYHPLNYTFKAPVRFGEGIVNISYKSKTSNYSYVISQQATHWNSELLRNDYISTLNEPYITVSSNNQVIYLYGLGQAAWINKGILYQISGSADLTQAQIVNIASST